MRNLLVYYSHYGNTAFVASEFQVALEKKGQTDMFELEYKGSKPGLLPRTFYRFFPSQVPLAPVPFDCGQYDLICLGIPVWGGRPSAPISKYLSLCHNIDNKRIICFLVYSIEASARTCFNYVKRSLEKNGRPKVILEAFVPWQKVQDKEFLEKAISEVVEKACNA